MASNKKDCWQLCQSRRYPGKCYYFNTATGEAVWRIRDLATASTQNYESTNMLFPEPESPPEENPWNYQLCFRNFHQPMLSFGEVASTSFMSPVWPHNFTPAQIPYRNYVCPVPISPVDAKRPMFKPIHGPSYRANRNLFQTNTNESPVHMNRNYTQAQTSNLKRSANYNNFLKEPILTKKMISRGTQCNETYVSTHNALNKSTDNSTTNNKAQNLPMLSKTQQNADSSLPESQETLTATNLAPRVSQPKQSCLGSSQSMENTTKVDTLVSSSLSLKHSFVFPIKPKQCSTKCDKLVSEVASSVNTGHIDMPNNMKLQKIGPDDFRHILAAKRRSAVSEGKKEQCHTTEKPMDSAPKKRVRFDLGVEDTSDAEAPQDDPKLPTEADTEDQNATTGAKEPDIVLVVADLDALLTDFQIIDTYVKESEGYFLVIPLETARAVQSAARDLDGSRVQSARRLARLLAAPPSYISVLTPEKEMVNASGSEDPALSSCWRVMERGQSAELITNNEELHRKAAALDLVCYTAKEVEEYLRTWDQQVSFSFKELDVTQSELQEKSLTLTHDKGSNSKEDATTDDNYNRLQQRRELYSDNASFIGSDTVQINNIEEEFDNNFIKEQDNSAKQESLHLKNDAETQKPEAETATKETTNINIFNLNQLMKGFSVKDKEMEDRILVKMEEYVCSYTLIMEDMLLEIMKDVPCVDEDCKLPLQNLLPPLREMYAEHRTVKELTHRLNAALECLYKVENGRVTRCVDLVRPYQFMKMLGYGILLVNSLLSIEPDNARLQECVSSLELLVSATEGATEPTSPCPSSPPRSTYSSVVLQQPNAKDQAEVFQNSKNHFPDRKSVHNPEYITEAEKIKENVAAPEIQTPQTQQNHNNTEKITTGRDPVPLKSHSSKKRALGTQVKKGDNNEAKQKNTEVDASKPKDNKEAKQKNMEKDASKRKLLRKLPQELTNCPPKMKNIERRERTNTEVISETITNLNDIDKILVNNRDVNEPQKVSSGQESIHYSDAELGREASSFVRHVQHELSDTLLRLFRFTEESVDALEKGLTEEKKASLHRKAVHADGMIEQLIYNLKLIIERESSDETSVTNFLLKKGPPASCDERIIKYKEVMITCLQQLEILESPIKTIRRVSHKDFKGRGKKSKGKGIDTKPSQKLCKPK